MCAKNTDTANIETKGFCWYKATNGIKRHLLVDVLGNPYFVHCTRANSSDDDGLLAIIKENKQYFLDLPVGHLVTILLDNGYHKEHLEQEIEKIEAQLSNRIKIEIAEKVTPARRTAAKVKNPAKIRFCGDQKAVDRRANKCVDQSVPSVVEELRRVAADKRSEDSDLRDPINLAENRLTANRFYITWVIPGTSLNAGSEPPPQFAGMPIYGNVIAAGISISLTALGYWIYRREQSSKLKQ